MNPDLLLSAAYEALRDNPPRGLDPAYVEGFFARNRPALLEIVRRAFPTARIEPTFSRLREEHRLGRLLLGAVQRHLQTRGPASAGAELAEMLDGLDDHVTYENRVLFPYLRGQVPALAEALDHAREEHEYVGEHLFALSAALRAGRRYEGPAIEAALHHFDEEEAGIVGPALAAGLARTPAGDPGRLSLFAADIERLAAPPESAPPEPTRWGGLRGAAIPLNALREGQRVVTEQGEHGVVADIQQIIVIGYLGSGRTEDNLSRSATLRLDSGRHILARGALHEELAPPTSVVPDIQVGTRWLAPSEVWSQTLGRYREISRYAEKAEAARKPESRRQWQTHGARARAEFLELYGLLAAWCDAWPHEPVTGLDPRLWRQLALEAREPRSEDESWELAWIRRAPADWQTRFKVGDRVVLHVFGPHGRQPDAGWTVAEIRGHEAILSRGDVARAEPLWMLKADDSAPWSETFTEPRYLRELAQEMLVATGHTTPYPTRGAAARAVKTFLAEHGIAVSTHVNQGSMVTSIDLRAPEGRWSPETVGRMKALLPGINVFNERQASFEPWQTSPEPYDPYADYAGKGAGVLIAVEHLPRFAAILAGALKAEGQPLNALGERRLAASARPGVVLGSGARGGATDLQRAEAAEGCRELDFELPGHGQIRVVCGQEGRRDTWHNLYYRGERYGFNGGRWARGKRPPEEVLAAVRERGVGAFG